MSDCFFILRERAISRRFNDLRITNPYIKQRRIANPPQRRKYSFTYLVHCLPEVDYRQRGAPFKGCIVYEVHRTLDCDMGNSGATTLIFLILQKKSEDKSPIANFMNEQNAIYAQKAGRRIL